MAVLSGVGARRERNKKGLFPDGRFPGCKSGGGGSAQGRGEEADLRRGHKGQECADPVQQYKVREGK